MKQVKALTNFDHHGAHQKGSTFSVTNATAEDLKKAGLVEIVEESEGDQPQAETNKNGKKGKS